MKYRTAFVYAKVMTLSIDKTPNCTLVVSIQWIHVTFLYFYAISSHNHNKHLTNYNNNTRIKLNFLKTNKNGTNNLRSIDVFSQSSQM